MPFGRPVDPDVKMRYCVCSPVTQRPRSGARTGQGADAIARTSTMRPTGTQPRSASGTGTVAASSGAPSWDTMSMRRATGISVSTGTNACPLFRQPRKPATMSGALCPSTTTGSRSSVRAASVAAMASDSFHSSPYVIVVPSAAR